MSLNREMPYRKANENRDANQPIGEIEEEAVIEAPVRPSGLEW